MFTKRRSVPYIPLFVSLLLCLTTLSVYWQVLGHDFILYDDNLYVTENSYVKSGLTRQSVYCAFTTTEVGFWIPMTWISLMLDNQLHGLSPRAFHLTNVIIHIANCVLLFFPLNRLTNAAWRSALVASLFALHPVHVESVAWVTERKDVLSTFF
jgi:protein O-mannosyl-transferase